MYGATCCIYARISNRELKAYGATPSPPQGPAMPGISNRELKVLYSPRTALATFSACISNRELKEKRSGTSTRIVLHSGHLK